MIFRAPNSWQELQEQVCMLLQQVGIDAEVNKLVPTPRGQIEIDVYGIDKDSVDQIKYLVECKHWNQNIPQTIVHSFTTVMHETGGHIGYIIASKGFQKGALDYIRHTNIRGLTNKSFQEHYFALWIERYFIPKIYKEADHLISYTEPINSARSREVQKLSTEQQNAFYLLSRYYEPFAANILFLHSELCPSNQKPNFSKIESFKKKISSQVVGPFASTTYTELLNELTITIQEVTQKFNSFFGRNIFLDYMYP